MPRSASNSRSRSPVKRIRSSPPAEPENACPFLVRMFVTKGRHTPMIEFEEGRLPLQDEFTAYGWNHSTPSSLIQLLLPSFPALYRSPYARYSFRHIYVDASSRGLYRTKDLASFTGRDLMESLAAANSSEPEVKKEKPSGRNGLDMEMELDDVPSKARERGGRKIEEKTLEAYGFITGDLLSVSLHIPEPRGALRRPTGPGAPGLGGPGGPGGERGNFPRNSLGGLGGAGAGISAGAGVAGAADRTGAWERGAPLPDQAAARNGEGRPSFGGLGSGGPDAGPPGGRWGRGGGQAGAGGRGGGGMGIRGRGRSRSPDYTTGGRNGAGEERGGRGGRSRSPDARRGGWGGRK